jgi:hypothetical protein
MIMILNKNLPFLINELNSTNNDLGEAKALSSDISNALENSQSEISIHYMNTELENILKKYKITLREVLDGEDFGGLLTSVYHNIKITQ